MQTYYSNVVTHETSLQNFKLESEKYLYTKQDPLKTRN